MDDENSIEINSNISDAVHTYLDSKNKSSEILEHHKKGGISDHTAIPNWSGYIYQGLCAAYVALRYCLEEPKKATKYYLSLDSYEDFSILDENKKIVSLHQCKCFAKNPGKTFATEFKHMRLRKSDYVKQGICISKAEMFFHTNIKNVSFPDDIKNYKYLGNTTELQPDEIENKIDKLIDGLNAKRKEQISKEIFKRRLYYWIDQKVLEIHRKTIENYGKISASKMAKGEVLEINDLKQSIDDANGFVDLQSMEQLASYCRAYYLKSFEDELFLSNDINEDIHFDVINKFEETFCNFPLDKLWNLLIRLNPHKKVDDKKDTMALGGDNASQLYEVINGVNEEVDEDIRWVKNGLFETPSALPSGENIKKLCCKIYNNRANLDVLFNYRWLVAKVDRTVDSIINEVPNIAQNVDNNDGNKPKKSDKIFNPQNIGILTIKDKNNVGH